MKKKTIIFAMLIISALTLTGCYTLAVPEDAVSSIEGTGSWNTGTFQGSDDRYISISTFGAFSNSVEAGANASGSIFVTDDSAAVRISVRQYGRFKDARDGWCSCTIRNASTGEELAHSVGEIRNSSFIFYNGHARKLVEAFAREVDEIIYLEGNGASYTLYLRPAGFVNALSTYILK